MDRFVAKAEGYSSTLASVVSLTAPVAVELGQIMLVGIVCEDGFPNHATTGGPGDWRFYGSQVGSRQLSVWGKKVTPADVAGLSYSFNFTISFATTWTFVVWEADELPELIGAGVGLESIGPTFDYMPAFPKPYDLAFAVAFGRLEPQSDISPAGRSMQERASIALQFTPSVRMGVWDSAGPVAQGERAGVNTQISGVENVAWFLLGYEAKEFKAVAYSSTDDLGQPWGDFRQNITLGLEERLQDGTYLVKDFLGQPVAVGEPVYPPSISQGRASYQLESILGRMSRSVVNKGFSAVLTAPNNTAKKAIERVLTELKKEFAWLDWETVPDLDLETSAGTVTPKIDVVQHIPEAKISDRLTVLEVLQDYLNPFVLAGYEYAPSKSNRLEIKPPARKQSTGQAIALGASKILADNAVEIAPRYEVATAATVEYQPWGFEADTVVAAPSTIRIMPTYWNPAPAGFFGFQQAPWVAPGQPTLGVWSPTFTDSQGNPIEWRELRMIPALMVFSSWRDSYQLDVNSSVDLPFLENAVLQPGTNITFNLTLKRWSLFRDAVENNPGTMSNLTATVTLVADGQEHLLHDFGGYWFNGTLDSDGNTSKGVVYEVYGKFETGKVVLRIRANQHQKPSFARTIFGPLGNVGWDFGTVLQIETTATAFAQKEQQTTVTFGDYPADFTTIPWLQDAQTNYGKNTLSLKINRYTLAIDNLSEDQTLRALLESILRERSRPRQLWEVPLGSVAPVTPFDVGKLVAAPFAPNGYGLLVSVATQGSSESGRLQSSVVARVEALAEEFSALYFNGSSLLFNGSNALGV
jgi:hypothetical protein